MVSTAYSLDFQVSFLVNSRTLAALKYNIMGFDTSKTGFAVWLTQVVFSVYSSSVLSLSVDSSFLFLGIGILRMWLLRSNIACGQT